MPAAFEPRLRTLGPASHDLHAVHSHSLCQITRAVVVVEAAHTPTQATIKVAATANKLILRI
jgi:hypothetical protein